MRISAALVVFGIAIAVPASARATWSVVGVDPATGEVGVAVASCVEAPFGTTLLPTVVGLAPGVGALAAQALLDSQTRDFAVELLTAGVDPADVIAMVNEQDGGSALRQYGVVTLDGQEAGFTGGSTMAWAGDVQSTGVSAQGNILYGPQVVDDALASYEAAAPRCPWTLADRLMLALEAGAEQGGDTRCSKEQSALAAVIQVARPGDDADAPTLDLRIGSQPQGGDNPVALLRVQYDAWRRDNPPDDSECGSASTGAATQGGDAGQTVGDEGAQTTAATRGDGAPADDDGSDGPGDGGPAGDAPGNDDGTSTLPPTSSAGQAAPATGSGCGCRPPADPGSRWPLGALLLVGLARRRRPTTS